MFIEIQFFKYNESEGFAGCLIWTVIDCELYHWINGKCGCYIDADMYKLKL
jgi:hypothetical protein